VVKEWTPLPGLWAESEIASARVWGSRMEPGISLLSLGSSPIFLFAIVLVTLLVLLSHPYHTISYHHAHEFHVFRYPPQFILIPLMRCVHAGCDGRYAVLPSLITFLELYVLFLRFDLSDDVQTAV
jgi:hypothetical protein